ncbi:hypothetical protein NQ317_015945 [Molorchus minor]|uniref:Uncharacterized protein n=1 Tax=Molorchus minor TaxID=1323400 RepID=A0ABQ9ITH7_9CUCU|nr:hypothetical protein NQ317_015945 [Molorchus minor]
MSGMLKIGDRFSSFVDANTLPFNGSLTTALFEYLIEEHLTECDGCPKRMQVANFGIEKFFHQKQLYLQILGDWGFFLRALSIRDLGFSKLIQWGALTHFLCHIVPKNITIV